MAPVELPVYQTLLGESIVCLISSFPGLSARKNRGFIACNLDSYVNSHQLNKILGTSQVRKKIDKLNEKTTKTICNGTVQNSSQIRLVVPLL